MDDIAELQQENARLRSMLARNGVMLLPAVPLPTESETDRLLALVEAAHPRLVPGNGEPDHRQHFVNAVHYLTFARRSDQFSKYAATVFADDAARWVTANGYSSGGCGLRAFCAACVASGVATATFDRFPYDVEIALSLGANTAQPFAGWKDVLAAGRVPQPVQPKRRAPSRVIETTITGQLR